MDLSYKQKIAETIFEHVHDGIIMLDRNFKILALNNAMEQWTDKPLSDLTGKDCKDVFHDGTTICPHCAASMTFEKGERTIEIQRGAQGERTKYAELSAYPIKDEAGSITGCVVFMQDVTERMRSQDKVTETKEYLEGFIDHSADAIVTSDLDGMITSWNKGAERIYGFAVVSKNANPNVNMYSETRKKPKISNCAAG